MPKHARTGLALLILLAALALLGCAQRTDSADRKGALSERERDSVLAESPLPGARVVGRALRVSDNAAARAARADSLAR